MMKALRTVFFGTPAYAVPALLALIADPSFDVVAVVTQPDRPAGRGRALTAPAVKVAALEVNLPVIQPETLRTPADREPIAAVEPDLFVVAAYGLIFGPKTLAIPRHGCVNLHASLLPRYRGSSPVTAAILNGDRVTGVTLMRMDVGLDTGDAISMIEVAIEGSDTTASLTEHLALAGASLAVRDIPRWMSGELTAKPQDDAQASLVRPLVKADGWIDWTGDAAEIERRVRAMQPWPRAWTTTSSGAVLQLLSARVANDHHGDPGTVLAIPRRLVVACGASALELETVQFAGSAAMSGAGLLNGRKIAHGERLGTHGAPAAVPPLIRPAR